MRFRAFNGLVMVIDACDGDAFDAVFASDIDDGVREEAGDVEVVEALDDVSYEAAGVGHEFGDAEYFCAFQGHASGHDEADVAAAQDDDAFSGHEAVYVDEALSRTGRIDACGPEARDVEGAARPFAAAHRENDGFRVNEENAVIAVHGGDGAVDVDVHDHRVELVFDAAFEDLFNKARGVFGAGQRFFERVQAKAVVNSLIEDAAQFEVAFED